MAVFISNLSNAQQHLKYVDSARIAYQIPAIGYAVVTADSIIELAICGFAKKDSAYEMSLANRFHIGSNTKAITSLIACDLVKRKKLKWNTSLFELFPEFRNLYTYDILFANLLTFKVPLAPFSYNTEIPEILINGRTPSEQRYQIAKYLLNKKPVAKNDDGLYLTNTGYVLAGLMMEKASGKEYPFLVQELGTKLGINFQFGSPNKLDKQQTWGHDEESNPIMKEHPKLSWLMSSGNINISLADYAKFIQEYLLAINGKSSFFSKKQMAYLCSEKEAFSFGWFRGVDEISNKKFYYNYGNANGFTSSVRMVINSNIAFVILVNEHSDKAEECVEQILLKLNHNYCK